MTHTERTRLLLLAASAGTEATLRRALFDWAMERDGADTPTSPEKLVSTGRPGIDYPPDWYRPSGPLEAYNPWWPPNVPQDTAWQSKPDVAANPEKLAADGFRGPKVAAQLQTGLYEPETRRKRHSGGNPNPQPEQ